MFVKTRQPGDCWDAPVNAIFFSGANTDVPVLELGNVVFKGGTSLSKAKGIGVEGFATDNNFYKIPFDTILKGGSGIKIRQCGTSLAKRVRMKCCDTSTIGFDDLERMAIEVRAISNCENPRWFPWVSPKEAYFECGTMQSCCQKLNRIAEEFNTDSDSPVTAEVSNNADGWFIDLISKIPGLDFHVIAQEGLTDPDVIVPNFERGFTAKTMVDWFGAGQIIPGSADKCMTVIEVFNYLKKPYRGGAGTSNPLTDPSQFREVLNHTMLVFDDTNTNSLAAKNAFITLANGTSQYNDILAGSTAADFPTYHYCIERTDAGDAAALDAVRAEANYTPNVIKIGRSLYKNGKSYYDFHSLSGTAPTADTGDTVRAGYCGKDDLPCTQPDGCPEVEGGCINC